MIARAQTCALLWRDQNDLVAIWNLLNADDLF